MSREQIEEMAKIPESEMSVSGYSKFSWKLWEAGICNMSGAQRADQIMRKQGYRKASEVVDEFVEHFKEKAFSVPTVYNSHFSRIADSIAKDLKKKHTESSNEITEGEG
jgi:hypothetical protein